MLLSHFYLKSTLRKVKTELKRVESLLKKLNRDFSMKTSGNGGGSSTFAQGGGKDVCKIDEVLLDIQKEIENEE